MTHPILLVLLLALVSCQKNTDTKTTTPPKPRPAIPRVYTDSIAKMLDLAMVPAARLPIGTNTYWKHYDFPYWRWEKDHRGLNATFLKLDTIETDSFYIEKTEFTVKDMRELYPNLEDTFYTSWSRKYDSLPFRATYYEAILICNQKSVKYGLDTLYSYQKENAQTTTTLNLGGTLQRYKIITQEGLFLKNLKREKGTGFRLATESEFNAAQRAGDTRDTLPKEFIEKQVTFRSNYRDYRVHPKSKDSNALGIYDLLGNAPEWIEDYSNIDSEKFKDKNYSLVKSWAEDDENNPHRILRGLTKYHSDVGEKTRYHYSYRTTDFSATLPNSFRCVLKP